MDEKLRDHLNNARMAQNTSTAIQKDMLDSIYKVYLAQVESQISSCEFVSTLSNETTEVMSASQLATVLCYMKCGRPVERFHNYANVEDRSAVRISKILLSNECVLIFLWSIYFCITPFRVTSSTAILLMRMYPSFSMLFPKLDGTYDLKPTTVFAPRQNRLI